MLCTLCHLHCAKVVNERTMIVISRRNDFAYDNNNNYYNNKITIGCYKEREALIVIIIPVPVDYRINYFMYHTRTRTHLRHINYTRIKAT